MMGVYVPTRFPRNCGDCSELFLNMVMECYPDEYGEDSDGNKIVCPLIEIDHTNTELLEFFNEFKKWKASKEVAKYINAVYGERRADDHTDERFGITEDCSTVERRTDEK